MGFPELSFRKLPVTNLVRRKLQPQENYFSSAVHLASLGGFVMPGAGSGILLIDFLVRPFLKIGMKFPLVLLILLSIFYGYIAYFALRSSYGQVVE